MMAAMSDRELVVLGTASQMPTRYRNHNGYLLLWDDEGVLVDPGEGTQRQLVLSGVRATRVTRICLTHLHGDHCLGLPGVLARLSQHQLNRPVHVHFPASGAEYVERLLHSSVMDLHLDLRLDPVVTPGVIVDRPGFRLSCAQLEHSTESIGWRIEDPPRRHLIAEELRRRGISGPAVAALRDDGALATPDGRVTLEEVSAEGPGHSASFVMDTRWCEGALELARDADLLVCESTFLDQDEARAAEYGHMTARQAGRLAASGGARRLVLTHFSARYPDAGQFLLQAREEFDHVTLAEDLMRVPLPPRRRP
jgi:ribonuclease Z